MYVVQNTFTNSYLIGERWTPRISEAEKFSFNMALQTVLDLGTTRPKDAFTIVKA